MIGDRSQTVASRMLGEHLIAEVDRHHPMSVGFEQSADRASPGSHVEDEAPRCKFQPIHHEAPPSGVLTEAQDSGPTLVVLGYVPKQPRRGRFGFLGETEGFDRDILAAR